MPEKSIREMGNWELFHYSLQGKVFRATLMGALVLGLVTLVVGLTMYTYSLINQYIGESFGLASSTAVITDRWIDEEALSQRVMEIYRGLTDEERSKTGTAAYREKFAGITESRAYQALLAILRDTRGASDVDDVYFGYYDQETQALVYICDPDDSPETGCFPGDWEALPADEITKFYSWDGRGKLYDIGYTDKYGWMCTSGVPLRNSEGTITGFILADITMKNITGAMLRFLVRYSIALLVTVIVVAVLMARRMRKTLVNPINDIAEAAKDYVEDRRKGIISDDHFSRLSIRTGDEIENLSLVMAEMEHDLNDYEDYLTQATAEQERITTELSLAARIQADMLPSNFPPFPERKDLDIYAIMDPAKEVGGDFYDFFLIDQDHLGLVIADVSGKGVPAALFMTVSKMLVQNNAMTGLGPAQTLEAVNRQLCMNNKEQMFVTIWFGILDLRTGHMIAANAGHEFPALKTPDSAFELLKDKHGFVIGGMENVKYKEYELQLDAGSKLFVYTDGVPEATDAGEQLFGTERLVKALNEAADETPQAILEHMQKAVNEFVGSAPQFDDLTMLCIEYRGPEDKGGAL